MRILLAGPVPPHPGGGAISRAQLASGFARAGHEVCVVAPITPDGQDDDRFARAHPELRIVRYVLKRFDPSPFRPPTGEFLREEGDQVAPLVASLIGSFAPDVVVVGRETFARYVPRVTREYGVPAVLLVRGSPTGHILAGQFPTADAERLLAEFRKVDRIVAVARYLELGLRDRGFANVCHVPNAIDPAAFRRRPRSAHLLRRLGIPAGSSVVLVPANLHQRKRPGDVVRSAAIAVRENPHLVYVFAGTGVLREHVERQCGECGLAAHVRFLGWVDYARMPALMNAADIVVMASESEGQARAYLEAMACERLLLASDIPAAREVVEDGVTGRLFRLGDAGQLAALTLEAAADGERRHAIGQRARASVRHRSVARAVPHYLRILEEVVAARGAVL
jgi:glycosyltransferase involved in cell wall biosynthesis